MTLFGSLRPGGNKQPPPPGQKSPGGKDLRRVQPTEDDDAANGGGQKFHLPSIGSSDVVPYQDGNNFQRNADRKKTCDESGVMSRSVRRHPSNASAGTDAQRPAAENMMSHAKTHRKALPSLKAGVVVSKKNAQINLIVTRNPKLWGHGEEDGGSGKPGIISAINEAAETVTVYWYESGEAHDHYKIGRKSELCRPAGAIPESLGGGDGLANEGMAHSAMEAMRKLFGGGKKQPPKQPPTAQSMAMERGSRRNSQMTYADKTQTVIMFDWDDTLFPTTYVRHDLGLSVRKRLQDQNLRPETMAQIQTTLTRAAGQVDQLLRLADKRGKVIIVTLAKSPWVTDSCSYFYPGVGELINKLNIQIVYAQEGQQVEYNKVNMMAEEQFETFWAEMKGRAIAKALGDFYSQYEGQSWKNIISLGDSDFERYGAMAATMHYAQIQGLVENQPKPGKSGRRASLDSQLSVANIKQEIKTGGRRHSIEGNVNGQEFKVRTKTFKMLDEPTVEELMVELSLLQQWLPLMVKLNDGFDVDLNSLDDNEQIKKIEQTLRPMEDDE